MRSARFWHLPGRHADEAAKISATGFPGEPLMTDAPDLIVTNPRVTTLDRS